jgi:D-cysteine desulfhydrase
MRWPRGRHAGHLRRAAVQPLPHHAGRGHQGGLKCRFVIEERVPGSYRDDASGNHFMFRLLGVDRSTVVPAGSDMAAAMQQVADEVARGGGRAYVIPGGGSNALGGLGYVACAQELQQQCFEHGPALRPLVVGSGSSGTHGGLVAGFLGNHIDCRSIGIGVSRDPADQEPLVHREAQAVATCWAGAEVPREAVRTVGGYWQPKYSVPNARMVEAVQMAGAHREPAARPGVHRQGHGRADRSGARGLFRAG